MLPQEDYEPTPIQWPQATDQCGTSRGRATGVFAKTREAGDGNWEALLSSGLPKTHSGKVLRGTIRKIAEGKDYSLPATIDDQTVLSDINRALASAGLPSGRPARLSRGSAFQFGEAPQTNALIASEPVPPNSDPVGLPRGGSAQRRFRR